MIAHPAVAAALHGSEPGTRSETESIAVETDDGAGSEEVPSPRYSDLLTEFLPFDRSSLENAIDRFLVQVESLGADLADLGEPTSLLPTLTAAALTVLASEVVLRRRRAREEARDVPAEAAEDELTRFAGFPNLWGLGEL
jgi:hypothetical protein